MQVFTKLLSASIIMIILSVSGIYLNTTPSCQINIRGAFNVESKISKDIDQTLENQILPVDGVLVKVERKSCRLCKWKKLFVVRTDDNGHFSKKAVMSGKACKKDISIRSKVKFQSQKLEIREGGIIDEWGKPPKWYKASQIECNKDAACDFET